MKFCEFNDNEIFNMTLIFNADINTNLAAIIILNYKLSFKLIN